MQQQLQPIVSIKNIVYLAILVLLMMWILNPYLRKNTDVHPEKYYELGLTCLNDFERTTHKSNYTLTNTYAKKVSGSKDIVLIRAQNQRSSELAQIECVYETGRLLYLSINNQRLEL